MYRAVFGMTLINPWLNVFDEWIAFREAIAFHIN